MSLRDVVGAVPYDFVYPSHSEGVRSKNDRVYAGSPISLPIVHGGLGGVPRAHVGIQRGDLRSGLPFDVLPKQQFFRKSVISSFHFTHLLV